MGTVSRSKIMLLAVLLFLVALFVKVTERSTQQTSKEPINNVLTSIAAWKASPNISMGATVEDALQLDDYLFRTYQRDNDKVSLYIGYYRNAAKVGAAHDPLVCFTGQGWRIAGRGKGTFTIPGTENLTINYSTMVAEQKNDRELILYWFQTNGATSAGTFGQKSQMLLQRLRNNPHEDNAFVRLSTRMEGDSPEAAQKRILEFVTNFYPQFHRYVSR